MLPGQHYAILGISHDGQSKTLHAAVYDNEEKPVA